MSRIKEPRLPGKISSALKVGYTFANVEGINHTKCRVNMFKHDGDPIVLSFMVTPSHIRQSYPIIYYKYKFKKEVK